MDMSKLLCWISFILMIFGFVSFVGGFMFLFDPFVWFAMGVILDHVAHNVDMDKG